jgi:hypothetical protein
MLTRTQYRHTFDPGLQTSQFPIKLYFLKRFVHRHAPGWHGHIFRWHMHTEEAFPRAFAQWQISIQPGEYIFEDFGNSFVILGQKIGSEPILFTFPIATSNDLALQRIHQNGHFRPLKYSDLLHPCYLSCMLSRGPQIGGFFHPTCYGVPGDHAFGNKKSH